METNKIKHFCTCDDLSNWEDFTMAGFVDFYQKNQK